MYNQEIKERFLSECMNSDKEMARVRFMFEAASSYEDNLCSDLAEMSLNDVIEAIKTTVARTYGTAAQVQSAIKTYVKWCIENGVFSFVNHKLLELKIDDIDASENFSKTLFKNEDDLIESIRLVRSFDDGYYDVVVSVFFWLGITQKQMMNIRIDDVDLKNNQIRVDNVLVPISQKLSEILALYSKTKSGTRMNKNGPRIVYRDDSYDLFIRKFSPPSQLGKKLTKSQIEDSVYLLNKAYVELGNESKFTSGNILSSGALCRVRELEKSGVDVFSIKNKDAVINAFRVPAKLHEITWLYKNYKKAFKL